MWKIICICGCNSYFKISLADGAPFRIIILKNFQFMFELRYNFRINEKTSLMNQHNSCCEYSFALDHDTLINLDDKLVKKSRRNAGGFSYQVADDGGTFNRPKPDLQIWLSSSSVSKVSRKSCEINTIEKILLVWQVWDFPHRTIECGMITSNSENGTSESTKRSKMMSQ